MTTDHLRTALERAGRTNQKTANRFAVSITGGGEIALIKPPRMLEPFSKADALLLAAWLVALAEDKPGQFAAALESVQNT